MSDDKRKNSSEPQEHGTTHVFIEGEEDLTVVENALEDFEGTELDESAERVPQTHHVVIDEAEPVAETAMPFWSPYNSFEAAEVLLKVLEADKDVS